jgi:hypothetical protein
MDKYIKQNIILPLVENFPKIYFQGSFFLQEYYPDYKRSIEDIDVVIEDISGNYLDVLQKLIKLFPNGLLSSKEKNPYIIYLQLINERTVINIDFSIIKKSYLAKERKDLFDNIDFRVPSLYEHFLNKFFTIHCWYKQNKPIDKAAKHIYDLNFLFSKIGRFDKKKLANYYKLLLKESFEIGQLMGKVRTHDDILLNGFFNKEVILKFEKEYLNYVIKNNIPDFINETKKIFKYMQLFIFENINLN